MEDRQKEIHDKGFDMGRAITDYGRIKVTNKYIENATLAMDTLYTPTRTARYLKSDVLKALAEGDIPTLRKMSNYFYNTSGLYRNMCHYYAFMYRYDWYVGAEILDKNINSEKVEKDFFKLLGFLDDSEIKRLCGEIALKVIREGAYYAYIVPSADKLILQELPANYCRTRYGSNGIDLVEFNLRYFDTAFPTYEYRMRVLKMFPVEFYKAYKLYKENKLKDPPYYINDGWYPLSLGSTIRFSMYNNIEIPFFANVIPAIMDLDAAQGLDRQKQMQKLLKILIQKLPLDKNDDLVFDVEEARDIHKNAVEMMRNAIGVDVLTTFADVKVEDMADSNTTTTTDDLKKVERTVYNGFGTSQNIFNAEGNLALTNSILQDESTIRNLLLQFNAFFTRVTSAFSANKKKYNFKFYMLETTQYNYRELSKMYKEQATTGNSKLLPQIALGQSQSFILHSAYFENEVLDLPSLMIPPIMSSTLSGSEILARKDKKNSTKNQVSIENDSSKEAGRPEKPDSEKSDKTLANRESLS